ncbi:DUF4145 domain-containing protein [Bradyrhizobium sp. Ash2021]|uniref:DUF4145 domain-containing protein n=1 Tax=Bradyrhizobium sp. Ash2021 TaxID=2954771 RepID=UPI0028151648|nr:DUF4145 domain-containing protein [Bradyrhizobium sp. Ash2021]WMT71108.1 DUF4145 domain-containing protein [Bradyrhizobium sp. Ash2021]
MTDQPPQDPKPEQIQAHCPKCGPGRFADVIALHSHMESHDDEHGMWSNTTSRILQCGGCKEVYFQQIYIFSEDYENDYGPEGETVTNYNERITYYPAAAKRKRPDWLLMDIEPNLGALLSETYNALDVDARVLAATGARTVFDRASELLKIDPALSFKDKLDALQEKGHIGNSEREHLDLLTDAGGAAAHRGWKPTTQQLDTIMNIVETFIYRTFVIDAEVKKLRAEIPPKQKRNKE